MRKIALLLPIIAAFAGGHAAPAAAQAPLFHSSLAQAPFRPMLQSGSFLPGPLQFGASPAEPGMQCRQAIRAAEQAGGVPNQLMAAIGRIESGRADSHGVVHPFPWSINAEGVDHVYDSKAAAIAGVRALQAQGVRSIDVGCMQVNLMFHPDAFANLETAFDPLANATYAARFLNTLYAQTGTWTRATAWYHSANPELGDDYQRKVAAVLPDELRKIGLTPATPPAQSGNAFAQNVWSANVWNTGGGAPMRPAANLSGPHLPPAPTALPGSGLASSGSFQGGGGTMLSNRADNARLIPTAPGTTGRGLDAYRARPIPVASIGVPGSRM